MKRINEGEKALKNTKRLDISKEEVLSILDVLPIDSAQTTFCYGSFIEIMKICYEEFID